MLICLLLFAGCTNAWAPADLDGDGLTLADGDCWDSPEGPEGSEMTGADIRPGAVEAWYDGVDDDCAGDDDFDAMPTAGCPRASAAERPSVCKAAELVCKIALKVQRLLRDRGLLDDLDEPDPDLDAQQQLQVASVQGLVAIGEGAGGRTARAREAPEVEFTPGRLCARYDWFNLHAATRVGPRRPFSDGTTRFWFSPKEFIGKLVALIPGPGPTSSCTTVCMRPTPTTGRRSYPALPRRRGPLRMPNPCRRPADDAVANLELQGDRLGPESVHQTRAQSCGDIGVVERA